MPYEPLFARAHEHARAFLASIRDRAVHPRTPDPETGDAEALGGPVPPLAVLDSLATLIAEGSVATPGLRYFGFVTGATMANVTGLAAGRHEVLRRAGWNLEADGLQGAPALTVLVGAGAHASIDTAARFLGFGGTGAAVGG
ncbi:MAG TPA: hypothetical protein VKH34_09035 [Vicinamibacterales bacterium]|nr:hypothetical protein [Vicinamibacterales bacterium]